MAAVHELISSEGKAHALDLARSPKERRLVEIAARALADEGEGLGITYAGFCMTSLPHKRLSDEGTRVAPGEWSLQPDDRTRAANSGWAATRLRRALWSKGTDDLTLPMYSSNPHRVAHCRDRSFDA
jgi:hypothetical protein